MNSSKLTYFYLSAIKNKKESKHENIIIACTLLQNIRVR